MTTDIHPTSVQNLSAETDDGSYSPEWSMFMPGGANLPYDMLGGPKYMAAFPAVAWSYIIIAGLFSVIGIAGNIMILIAFFINKNLQKAQNVFIFNLCLADLMVTGLADPFSIIGITGGKKYFDERPGFCNALSVICFTSCVTVLLSMGGISFNRYLHICHPNIFRKVFSLKKNIAMCISFWFIGFLLASCTLNGWSNNRYDPKMLECIWNRQKSFSFTIFFGVGIVFTPVIIITFSYVRIFMHVRASRAKVQDKDKAKSRSLDRSLKLAKTLFLIFSFFVFCWTPYALLVLLDWEDRAPLEVHLYIVLLAHLHSTGNCIIYGLTNVQFADSFKRILGFMTCGGIRLPTSSEQVTMTNNTSVATGTTGIHKSGT